MAAPDARQIYVVDASSWISIEGHPAQNRILYAVATLIEAHKIECPKESWDEVIRCPWVIAWMDQYKEDMIQNHRQKIPYLTLLGEITGRYPSMAGARTRRNRADPYVLANAIYGNRTHNPTAFVVVTNEGTGGKRKLPTACKDYGVECLTLTEMLQREFPNESW
jgi:Domain of unknown function (DUF4411)